MKLMLIFRTKYRRIVATISLLLLAACIPAFAWNDEGHMTVAYVAYRQLTPATRNRADALLKLNPYYSKWLAAIPAGTSEADTKMMIFMIAATWPDQIRNDHDYVPDGPSNGDRPDGGPASSQNIGYSDHLLHKYWHFIDLPYSQDGTPLPPTPSPNAQTQIAAFRTALSSAASGDVKSYDLAWLEHLVGDIHQPLHAITRVGKDTPDGDAGGNFVTLCSAPCRGVLHTFWDRLIGSQDPMPSIPAPQATPGVYPPPDFPAELKSAMNAAKTLPAPNPQLSRVADESVWAKESFEAAKKYVYVPPIGVGTGPFTVTPEYLETARNVAKQRVALAAVRLANLLNGNLK